MAVQTSDLGPNSAYVVYTIGETNANVAAAVYTWLQNHGWELHDGAASASSKVFKALCIDAVTHKYMMVGYDANGIYMRIFETWDANTHTGTNETWYGGQSAVRTQRTDFTNGGYIYVYATQRYCVLFAKTNGGVWGAAGNNSWAGCFEFTKDERDTRKSPPFGYMDGYNSVGLGIQRGYWGALSSDFTTAANSWFNSYGTYSCFSLPKTNISTTGQNAEKFVSVGCSLGASSITPIVNRLYNICSSHSMGFGTNMCVASYLHDPSGTSLNNNYVYIDGYRLGSYYSGNNVGMRLIDLLPSTNNPISSSPWALTMWIYEMGNTKTTINTVVEPRGRICGVKLLQQSIGDFMDTITINVDEYGFMHDGGTETTHHILTGGATATTVRFAIPA